MIAFTAVLPRKSSRTSTHAVIVPSTAFVSAASADITSESFRAATAWGEEATVQNASKPLPAENQISAAIGSATTTDRNVITKPMERAAPAPSSDERRATRRLGTRGASTTASGARGRHSEVLLDRGHDARRRVEPLLVHRAPAADHLVVDREHARPHRVLLLELLGGGRLDRAEPVLPEQHLRRMRLHVADERGCRSLVRAFLQRRDEQLDQHRLSRDHVLDVPARQPRVDRLALERDQDVALAREERVRRVAAG